MSSPAARTSMLAVALIAIAAVALCAGASGWYLPWSADPDVLVLRAPRVVLAALVGASLALAGVAMQTLLGNPLAEPFVLGMSGGASAGAVTSLWCWPGLAPGPAAAAGAALAAVIVRALGRGAGTTRLLLTGVTVGALGASVTGLVLVLAPERQLLRSATFWLFGGLGIPDGVALIVPGVVLVTGALWLSRAAERLDRLGLGDDAATALGVDVPALRRAVLAIGVVLTAAAVALGGLIGFVGLIGPHAARRLVGARHRYLIPAAALAGATLLVLADATARSAFSPREVPVGLLTALAGGPAFLALLGKEATA